MAGSGPGLRVRFVCLIAGGVMALIGARSVAEITREHVIMPEMNGPVPT